VAATNLDDEGRVLAGGSTTELTGMDAYIEEGYHPH
jgi:hypothetical protein